MRISIFGLGYVGCVSLGCLAKNGHTVIGVDINENKIKLINNGLPTIIEKDIDIIIQEEHLKKKISATNDFRFAIDQTEISIVTVGTPEGINGHLNMSYIFNVAEQIGQAIKEKKVFHTIIIRSTVLPGTITKFVTLVEKVSGLKNNIHFGVASNPEFLREGTAVQDYFNPPLILIGADNQQVAETVTLLYKEISKEIIITDIEVAEIMKYVNNTYHALKIAFANEVGNICSAYQIDSHKVMEIFCMDKTLNISPYYFKPGFAYGGSCLPKDLKGLQTLAHDKYIRTPVIENIDKSNDLQINRVVNKIQNTGKKKIAFLGLSFKAGTDDLRNSPAVSVVETILGKGYEVQIYDKNVHLSNLTGTNKEYIDKHIPHLYKFIVPHLNELIDYAEVIVVNNREPEYITALLQSESSAEIIDLVRLPHPIRLRQNYSGVNW